MRTLNKNIFSLFVSIFLLTGVSVAQRHKSAGDSLLKVLPTATTDTGRINLLNDIAYEYINDSAEKSEKYCKQALALSEKLNFEYGKMNSFNNLGLLQYYSNNYDKALEYYYKSRDIAKTINDKSKLAAALNNIGLVFDDKADYNKALDYYLQSLKLLESDNHESKWQLASTLNNVGLIYQNQKQYDQALKYLEQSMKIKEEIGNRRGVGSSLHNIGLIYKQKGDYDKSLEYYTKALDIRKETGDESGTALTLNNIGSVYESENLYDKAFPYFVEALKIRQKLKDKYNLCIGLFSIGSNYCSRKQYDQGFAYINQALVTSKELGAKELIKYGYEQLAEFSAIQKNFEKAYGYQKELIAIKDSIMNSESTKQLNELQTKFESEKKEKEIALLTKDSEIQSLQLNKNKMWIWLLVALSLFVFTFAGLFYNRYKLKLKANLVLEHQNTEITQKKKEITDSINYAKRIQESILPPTETWNSILPSSFIFYRPKDIVSGDFYWIEEKNDTVCFAAVDCTGHGVPGALMSVVGFNLLTQAINEVNLLKPSEILKHLDAGVTKTLRQSEEGKGVKDGMDLSLCSLNTKTLELQYAGAFNSLYYVSNGNLTEIKADKFPIGVNLDGIVDNYTNHTIQLKKGDSVYLFSDGYADQFGGPKGKKFKYNQLKSMLLDAATYPISEQRNIIESTFDKWKGTLEQIDDVVVIGVRI